MGEAGEAHVWRPGAELDAEGHPIAPFADELRATEEHIRRRRQRDQELVEELDATEVRIGETRERTQQAIEEAQRRLEEIQAQATEAEERASRAEQIAEYKQAEAEREHRLLEMLEKINEAERRAREAEARARQAVADVARPFEPLRAPNPLPPDAPASIEDLKSRPFGPGASEGESGGGESDEAIDPDAPVNINEGSFEELRAVGLSVTQVGRLLAVRERISGFSSIEELDSIPGFPREFLDSVRDRLTV
jgi:DNA uptake protein ComE-like DNA-binding protein